MRCERERGVGNRGVHVAGGQNTFLAEDRQHSPSPHRRVVRASLPWHASGLGLVRWSRVTEWLRSALSTQHRYGFE